MPNRGVQSGTWGDWYMVRAVRGILIGVSSRGVVVVDANVPFRFEVLAVVGELPHWAVAARSN